MKVISNQQFWVLNFDFFLFNEMQFKPLPWHWDQQGVAAPGEPSEHRVRLYPECAALLIQDSQQVTCVQCVFNLQSCCHSLTYCIACVMHWLWVKQGYETLSLRTKSGSITQKGTQLSVGGEWECGGRQEMRFLFLLFNPVCILCVQT